RRVVGTDWVRFGDAGTDGRWAAHNEPVAQFILHSLTSTVTAVSGVPMKGAYPYFACYAPGASLIKHTDRAQCEVSLSMLIDFTPEPEAESLWPLLLETKKGIVSIQQRIGETAIYRGREIPHARDELPEGHTSTHLFLHYVPETFTGPLD